MKDLSVTDVHLLAMQLAMGIVHWTVENESHILRPKSRPVFLYGVPRGGISAALAVAAVSNQYDYFGRKTEVISDPADADFIIDDLIDSGATELRWRVQYPDKPFFALLDKRDRQNFPPEEGWIVFPWEKSETHDESGTDIVRRLLQFIGEDPNREGLRDTPQRFLKAWKEWASGYAVDPQTLFRTFEDGAQDVDEMVIVHNIPIVSKCEHHLADIIGTAHVGYVPDQRIIGLSKIPRVVEVFSRRLQVQERLTSQIANAINDHLKPKGVGVIITASHACMSTRGVKIHGSVTTTSKMLGALRQSPEARHEFLNRCDAAERAR